MKKLIAMLLCLAMVFAMAACANTGAGETTYAIVCKDASNPYMLKMIEGFKTACEALGVKFVTESPETTSVDDQINIVNKLVSQGVKGIAIAANDAAALEATINEAKKQGVVVVTLDADTKGSQMFVNQAGVDQVAQVLVDSVADMCGADGGDFAILSASSTADNQNQWIDAMKKIIAADAKYSNLNLVEVVYGDDEPTKSTNETQNLLTKHPNLEVICCPTTVGILAAAEYVQSNNANVKIAGLGLPSEMKNYVGDDKVCPYMYLWNPIDVGNCAAYMIKAIADGKVGEVGTEFTAENGKTYKIEVGGTAEKQIIVGPPFKFDGSNIADWADVY